MKKNTALITLESALISEKTVIKITKDTRPEILLAVRIVAHKRKEITHYIHLNTSNNVLAWANNKRSSWEHQFADAQQANDWWQRMIVARTKQIV